MTLSTNDCENCAALVGWWWWCTGRHCSIQRKQESECENDRHRMEKEFLEKKRIKWNGWRKKCACFFWFGRLNDCCWIAHTQTQFPSIESLFCIVMCHTNIQILVLYIHWREYRQSSETEQHQNHMNGIPKMNRGKKIPTDSTMIRMNKMLVCVCEPFSVSLVHIFK